MTPQISKKSIFQQESMKNTTFKYKILFIEPKLQHSIGKLAQIGQVLIRKLQINHNMQKLWSDSIRYGKLSLKNRVVLTALTRRRCQLDGVPTDLVAEYYGQRTGAGLMFTESAAISQRGIGFPGQGNIFNEEQVEGWRKVLKVVHEKGSKLYIQVFHAGRSTHPSFNGNQDAWAPSAVKCRDRILELAGAEYPIPKEMTKEDINTLKSEYQNAFLLAKEAGFDGVQLHGSFGYLIDQFLRTLTNQRNDEYGGSPQKRTKFPLQVIDIALKHFEPHQVSIKLSPTSRIHDMFDQNPFETYSHLLKELNQRDLGFVELAQSAFQPKFNLKTNFPRPEQQIKQVCKTFRPFFKGLIIGNYGFTPQTGIKAIREGNCDLVSFGKSYISHPDLAQRIINGLPLDNKLDMTTLYYNKKKGKVAGYTDYPFYTPK